MKNITAIIGKKDSGKTTIAKEMVINKKAFWIIAPQTDNNYLFSEMQNDIDTIVIDNATNIQQLIFILDDILLINKRREKPFKIKRPDVIIIFDKIDIINLNKFNNRIDIVSTRGLIKNKQLYSKINR